MWELDIHGTQALYAKSQEQYGSPMGLSGLTYFNLWPIKFPGETTLPTKTIWCLLSSDKANLIIPSLCWQHAHSARPKQEI